MGGLLAKCVGSSTEEQANPLGVVEPYQVELSLAGEEEKIEGEVETEETSDEPLDPEKAPYQVFLLETLNTFRKEKLFTDFTLKVNDKDFPVHKNVLAASCDYFNELFSKHDDSNFVLHELAKLEPSAVENVINFLYTGKCKLDRHNVTLMLHATKVLGIEDLLDPLEKNMALASVKTMNDEAPKRKMFNSHNQGTMLSKL